MRTVVVGFFLLFVGCAQVPEQPSLAEEYLGPTQVTNGTSLPNITVRALRYNDHVSFVASCFLLEGGSAKPSIVRSARAQCESVLAEAVLYFQAATLGGL